MKPTVEADKQQQQQQQQQQLTHISSQRVAGVVLEGIKYRRGRLQLALSQAHTRSSNNKNNSSNSSNSSNNSNNSS
jgi:hypothetical protein